MNRQTFRASPSVRAFLEWAGPLPWARPKDLQQGALPPAGMHGGLAVAPRHPLAGLQVRLDIPSSKFVPRGISKAVPFSELPLHYLWRAPNMVYGDIAEAGRYLGMLRDQLQQATACNDWNWAQNVCFDLLLWGGERNRERGARPEIQAMAACLCQYLRSCDALIRLDTADLAADGSLAGVPHFSSMWVKVYALMSGSPIYDSRVAGAIATLVETWRIQSRATHLPLPVELTFPSVANRQDRTVQRRYPGAQDPGRLRYGALTTASRWAGATVRLGWLIQELLRGDRDWRVAHCVEAALFMAGYDTAGIDPVARAPARPRRAKGSQAGTGAALGVV
ncbi:hypothetical protein [Ramlibacter sp. AN1133]|uniref:hypothetical protein n=1 Tax=Ramlibacter sp. AN1133 TaxID=3133429 RepID=UPI0030C23DD4